MNLLDLLMIPGLDNSKEIERLRKESKEHMIKPRYIYRYPYNKKPKKADKADKQ